MADEITYNKSIEYAAEYLTKAMHESIRKIHKEKNFPISHEEYIILETIFISEGIIQIDIAREILMQRSYVGKLLNKLEKLGYVERRKEIKGKKQIIYKNYLTENGNKLYQEIRDIVISETHKLTSINERKEALYITDKLIEIADKIKKFYKLSF
jgi:DNA-binding MarR family transcriptional regulator